jgi:hypothetical protein
MTTGETKKPVGPSLRGTARARTTAVIDQLLSRGPVIAPITWRPEGPTTAGWWTAVSPVLRRTTPSLLEGHLTWLVARAEGQDPRAPQRIALEDQARILIRALDEIDEDDAVTVALEQRWTVDDVTDSDDGVLVYAEDLRSQSAGQPAHSPYVALAGSAADMAEVILEHRGSPVATRRFA